ncbi:hypothetical protein [Roseibium alexandrii]|uniref:hypothetical protein n=1 Tax=Roseibium alexandrii TaxID=388408 RepID=UPI003752FA4A
MPNRECILDLIKAGASIDVTAKTFNVDILTEFAEAAAETGTQLIIPGNLSNDMLLRVVVAGRGSVTVKYL